MEIPAALSKLANILKVRKQLSRPYNLLLTSTISLTPAMLKNICNSENWQDFREYLQALGPNDRLDILSYHLGLNNQDGYDVVARLVKAGYFSTILTTNLDSTLENALSKCGLQPPIYRTLIVDRDRDEYVSTALESPSSSTFIIKLHGSLNERVLPATYPDFFELREPIRHGLERYLNQDIIIAGAIDREDDIIRSLTAKRSNSIYYAHPHSPSSDDAVVKTITARRNDPSAFVICEPFGDFVTFFATLESLLKDDKVDVPPPKNEAPEIVQQEHRPAESIPLATPTLAATLPSTSQMVELQHTRSPSQTTQTQKPASADRQETGKDHRPIVLMLIRVFCGVLALAALLGTISIFVKQTPTMSAVFIVPLLIILGVFVLGLMGILNADQITQIFSQGLHGKSEDAKNTDSKTSKS